MSDLWEKQQTLTVCKLSLCNCLIYAQQPVEFPFLFFFPRRPSWFKTSIVIPKTVHRRLTAHTVSPTVGEIFLNDGVQEPTLNWDITLALSCWHRAVANRTRCWNRVAHSQNLTGATSAQEALLLGKVTGQPLLLTKVCHERARPHEVGFNSGSQFLAFSVTEPWPFLSSFCKVKMVGILRSQQGKLPSKCGFYFTIIIFPLGSGDFMTWDIVFLWYSPWFISGVSTFPLSLCQLRASAVLAWLALGSGESAVGRSAILASHEISQHCSVSIVQDSHQLRGHFCSREITCSLFSTDSTEAIITGSRLSVYIQFP